MRVVRDIVRRACVYAATPRARARASRGVARAVRTYIGVFIAMYERRDVRTSAFSSRCTYIGVVTTVYVHRRRHHGVRTSASSPRCTRTRADCDCSPTRPRRRHGRARTRTRGTLDRDRGCRFDFPRATVDHVPSSTHDDDDGARGGRARGAGARDGKGGDVDVTRATDGETM